jgi:hypothetical protein
LYRNFGDRKMKCRDTQHRIVEMPKPDLKEMNARTHEANPMVQVNLEYDRKVTFSLTVNPSVTNLLVKRFHDCESVGVSVARTIVFFFPKEMRSATAVDMCIKENETDCE